MKYLWGFLFFLVSYSSIAQIEVEGYVFESGNRGYISGVNVVVSDVTGQEVYGQAITDQQGTYRLSLPQTGEYLVTIQKPPFVDHRESIRLGDSNEVAYLKHEIVKKPGYVFEITLAEKGLDSDAYRTGLQGALVEVYNNTKKREEFIIEHLEDPEFKVDFIKGNHYTILVRKEGFLAKRMEAFVDVEGCILCFEGVGQVTPGVSDNLTESNTRGVLLANVEMDRYFEGKVIGVNDIYYELNESKITKKGSVELDKVAGFIKDNPNISLELGSHTDSRGKTSYNQALSDKRAAAAVAYLTKTKGVPGPRLAARGYGESQLTNHCDNDVRCSEAEHAINRRTELKVIEVNSIEGHRSLRQMKTDELMDEILLDLQAEGEIRVAVDSNLDKELDKRAEDRRSPNHSAATKTIDNPKNDAPVMDSHNEHLDDVKSDIEYRESSPTLDESRSIVEEADVSESDIAETIESNESSLDPSRYSPNYTGYKIVLMFSRYTLSEEHPLYARFENLDVYTTADGNKLYMIESYSSRQEAELRLQKRFITSFPKAYVVGFEEGIITD